MLNIPIPTLFFADDEDKKVVVDGQQRLMALKSFLDNAYALQGLEVLTPLNGRRFDNLTERQQRIINNRTLRCLVISAKSDSEIRFQVFERLNQGGVPLKSQEVRHCVYRGSFNDLLHELVENAAWLDIYGRTERHPRMVDCELVLRFFAVGHSLPDYNPPLKKLLTNYMRDNLHMPDDLIDDFRGRFYTAIRGVECIFGDHPFRRVTRFEETLEYDKNINRAIFDIQMILADMIDFDWLRTNAENVRAEFTRLCTEDGTFADSVSRATADKRRFDYRLHAWAAVLRGLGADLVGAERIPDKPEL